MLGVNGHLSSWVGSWRGGTAFAFGFRGSAVTALMQMSRPADMSADPADSPGPASLHPESSLRSFLLGGGGTSSSGVEGVHAVGDMA